MPKPMDNFKVEVISYGDDHLEAAICLCLDEDDKVEGWSVNPEQPDRLWIFQWIGDRDEGAQAFPCKMDRKAIIEFVKGWLREQDYGSKPRNFDGSTSRGFRVTNEGRESIWTMNRVLTVEPCWAMHGK